MKQRIFAGIAFLGLTVLLSTSCAKLPQTEIDAANVAVEGAKAADADLYVHDTFVALQDSLNGVMVDIEAQKSKFFKSYSTAKEGLVGVAQFAGEVAQQAVARKEELKKEIEATVTEVKGLVEADRQLVAQAPKGKEGASALLAIKAEIDAIDSSLVEVNTLFQAGDYIVSIDKVKAAKEKATSINAELTEVIAKYRGTR